jgi:hypothetical protein
MKETADARKILLRILPVKDFDKGIYNSLVEDEQGNCWAGGPWRDAETYGVIAVSPEQWEEMKADPRVRKVGAEPDFSRPMVH